MKKIYTILFAATLALGASAQTQDATVVAQDTVDAATLVPATTKPTAADSLAQRVAQLEKQVNTIEEDQKMESIFKRKKYVGVTFGSQTLKNQEDGMKYKSKFSVGIQGSLYTLHLHKKPIGNVLKIGLEVGMDFNFAQYKSIKSDEDEEFDPYSNYGEEEAKKLLDKYDMMHGDAGLALGPIFRVAPFSYTNGGFKDLRVYAYYHITPSYSGIILDDDIYSALCWYHGIGVGLTWKMFSIGYECRFGSAKYKLNLDSDNIDSVIESGDTSSFSSDKSYKYKTNSNRLVIRINL